jgi:serine/threonine protein kinase
LSADKKQGLMEEITNMKAFRHPLIVEILDDFMDSAGHLCLVQELYPEGDFSDYLNKREGIPFSEKEILHFLASIFLAVFHLNSRKYLPQRFKTCQFLDEKRG